MMSNLFENLQLMKESNNSIISEFKEFLKNKNAQYIASEIDETKDGMQIVIYDGDWKHEHLYMKHLLNEFFTDKGIDISITSEEIGESDQDTFSARYDITFNAEHKEYTTNVKSLKFTTQTEGTSYKRIASTSEFDNGHVIFNDWKKMSDEEAEELAKQKSIENPDKIYYVKYDNIMNPSSDIKWKNGKMITEDINTDDEIKDLSDGSSWSDIDNAEQESNNSIISEFTEDIEDSFNNDGIVTKLRTGIGPHNEKRFEVYQDGTLIFHSTDEELAKEQFKKVSKMVPKEYKKVDGKYKKFSGDGELASVWENVDTSNFTQDDLDEFSNDVIEKLSDATHADIIADVVDCYLDEDTNELELTLSYNDYEHTNKEKIDMRKIKTPKDLIKAYSHKFVNDFLWNFTADDEHEEMIKESNDKSKEDIERKLINLVQDKLAGPLADRAGSSYFYTTPSKQYMMAIPISNNSDSSDFYSYKKDLKQVFPKSDIYYDMDDYEMIIDVTNFYRELTESNHNEILDKDYATGEKIYNALVEYLNSLDQIGMDGKDCNWEPSNFNAKNLNADGEIYLVSGAYILIYPYVNEWAEDYFKVSVVESNELSTQLKNGIERIFNKFKTNKWKLVFED